MAIHFVFFFFNDTATTEIYTLSLHDALPICRRAVRRSVGVPARPPGGPTAPVGRAEHLHWRQFLEVPGLAGADLPPRTLLDARPLLQEALRGRVPARIQRGLPGGVRRFRLLPIPHAGILEQAFRAGAGALPLRLQSAGTDYL